LAHAANEARYAVLSSFHIGIAKRFTAYNEKPEAV
jgi:hypothetical protein